MQYRIPHNWVPEKHHLPVLRSGARYKVIVWHRKARKTTLAINELLRWAFAKPDIYWYVAPYYGQAKKIVWDDPNMLAKYCPPDVWNKRNNSELKLTFPNGSILYVLGADKPDSLRGPNPRGVVFDEYGDMRAEMWSAIVQPIMSVRGDGWCWFTGTPKGANDFKFKYDYAKHGGDGKWAAWLLKASESGIITPEALADARKTTTEAFFSQEYECEFLESASQFFRGMQHCTIPDVDNPFIGTRRFQMGVDLAKYQDWTVLTAIDLETFKVRPQERFNQVDWNLQKARIEAWSLRHNKGRMYIDATGVGDPIVEDLQRVCSGVEGVKFTEEIRKDMLKNLAIKIEQRQLQLPNDEGLLAELQSFRYELGETGKTKICVPDGCHDDRVISLALAVRELPAKPVSPRSRNAATQEIFDRFAAI